MRAGWIFCADTKTTLATQTSDTVTMRDVLMWNGDVANNCPSADLLYGRVGDVGGTVIGGNNPRCWGLTHNVEP